MKIERLRDFCVYPNQLFIWGAGEAGINFFKSCCIFGIKPKGFFDNGFAEGKILTEGLEVFPIAMLEQLEPECSYFLISSIREMEVVKQLNDYGFYNVVYKNTLGMPCVDEYEELGFSKEENPELSVLITAYNEWDCTYSCLKSLLENGNKTSFEVILGDDCSEDMTTNAEQYLKNVTVVHHKNRMNYLGNVNEIAKRARGKYIMLLGNDTFFSSYGYIDSLMNRIRRDSSIGMIVGKIWVPWKVGYDYNTRFDEDGTPQLVKCDEECNVDAVWPIATIIPKKIWEDLGGFDDIYLPVYYEDTDFCMRVIKCGYDVVSYPKTEITHFGGGTYRWGGWLDSLNKNREIFENRWKNHFSREIRERYWERR